MRASKKPKPAKAPKIEELDLDPDAWPKFEKLIRNAAKKVPKPRAKPD